jgi:hypothetical protein
MQEISAAPEQPLAWPWQPEDIALSDEDDPHFRLPWWHRVRPWMVITWLVGVILSLVLANAVLQAIYQHDLAIQAQWIAQQSQTEARCLQRATNDAARTACARALAMAVSQRQTSFDHAAQGLGDGDAATEMHSAFDALYASACYNTDAQTADTTCLQEMASSLRALAVLDANAAIRSA